jgi:N-acetylgalactosamine-N,N'-diacetylbacillosaminyl-diphospho-undecaprenol 4-alpha-N-acetylgalactosaminyltransferase
LKKTISILVYSLDSGGAERVVSILLSEFKNRYNMTLFLMNNVIFYDIPQNIKIVYLENSNPKDSGIIKLLKLPILAWKYKKLNKSEVSLSFMNRPNYINILAKLMGMKSKVVISERAMPSLQHKFGLKGKINRLLIKNLYKYADTITANSKGNSNDLIQNFNCKEVLTINNPFDIKSIEELSNNKVNFRDEEFTFITIGRLDSGKNHKLIIEVMKSIDAKLYIIGNGELKNILQKQIKDLNLENKVFILGKQYNPYKYMKQADCFVFSSLYEGFPNVIVESLACNLPVISSDCLSGPREILAPKGNTDFQLRDAIEKAKYGILIPVNNADKLTESMNLMINDDKLRDNYKQKAKSRAKDFNKDKIIREWIKVVEK